MAQVVVIGGGIVGCSIALECARRGRSTTLIDAFDGVGRGSTSKSTAIIRQLYNEPHSIRLAIEGLRLWEEWEKHLGHAENLARFHQPGVLWVMKPADLAKQPVALMKSLGAQIELLDEAALTRRFPTYRFSGPLVGGPAGGLLETKGGYIDDPVLAVANVAEAARRAGVEFRLGEKVVSVEHDDGAVPAGGKRRIRAVTTGKGERVEGEAFVNAAGPWSAELNRIAGAPMPLATAPNLQWFFDGRETALDWKDEARAHYPVCGDAVNGIYFRPHPTKFRVGTILPADDRRYVTNPDDEAPVADEPFLAEKSDWLRRRQPGARLVGLTGGSGLYDVTVADWCPIFDKSDIDGWFVAIGTSGKWFKSAPVIGWIMAELIQWVSRGHDPDRAEDRLVIRLPRTGHELALADFARWRTPHRTGGVLA